jgi:tripartite-type tricarboxylate transporter receptor subunit TctC
MKTGRSSSMLFVGVIVMAFTLMLAPDSAVASEKDFIRLIVPHAAGSGVDVNARNLSDQLAKVLGKPVVIENIPGAGGIKGIQEVARAPKDGYTLGLTSSNLVINPSIYKDLPYDPIKDITPISIVGTDSFVLATYPAVPASNVKELIALAKSQPGKLNYGSAGNGTVLHLAGELFCSEAGVKITHVPYKGGSQLMTDLIGGHVEMAFLSIPQCLQQVKGGKLRAIALSTPKRSSALPDVPTLAESGLPNYSYDAWWALIGPAGLPPEIIKRLNAAVKETIGAKDVQEKFAPQGTQLVGSTPEEAVQVFKTDLAKNATLVKQSGATLE